MTFETELLDHIGQATDSYDIRVVVRKCYFYDFDGSPVRLWDGQGKLFAGGHEWLGTIDADGTNHHQTPALRDARDGASPRYRFGLPYLDKATFDALKADQALARGRELTIYHALCKVGEGMRPATPLRFKARLQMRGTEFSEQITGDIGQLQFVRSAYVTCRSLEYGRSRLPNGTYTDTAQRTRAASLGIATDSGCSFVAGNYIRTFTVGG
jgi:hypothetical protein